MPLEEPCNADSTTLVLLCNQEINSTTVHMLAGLVVVYVALHVKPIVMPSWQAVKAATYNTAAVLHVSLFALPTQPQRLYQATPSAVARTTQASLWKAINTPCLTTAHMLVQVVDQEYVVP